MKNALILHGWGNNSKDNWFPWLKAELEKKDWKVWVPDLPHTERPDISNWDPFILNNFEINNETVIIGHSAGSVEALSILSQLNTKIQKAILVAGFTNLIKEEVMEDELKGLFKKPFDWKKIRENADKIILIHSDNDPYVLLKHGEILKENLHAELIVKKNHKHFSVSTGGEKFKKLPIILELLEE